MDCLAGVVGVVLGAGSSTRLGQPKQVLALGDTTVLGWTVREAEASRLDRVVVVLGAPQTKPRQRSRCRQLGFSSRS